MTNSILYSNFSFALPLTLLNGKVVEAGETELLSKPLINIYKYYKALFCVPPVVPKMPAKASVSPFKHLSETLYH